MRIAALYDIHGNFPALKAVLQDVYAENVDLIIVGGDVVAGPMPLETLRLLQDVSSIIPTQYIHGNAESEVLRYLVGEEIKGLSERANEEAQWVGNCLSSVQRDLILSWPLTLQYELDGWREVLFCHATPHNDIDIFTRTTPAVSLLPIFKNLAASLVICGHTHMQFDRVIGHTRVVNAGSVGLPFGHTGADWLMLDQEIEFMHSDYNLAEAAERIRASDYPHAESFATNNVLQAPSEKAALEMLTHLEAVQAKKR